jgi:hypothetical protein
MNRSANPVGTAAPVIEELKVIPIAVAFSTS